jgi:serine/threonine protein kinase
MVSDLSEMIQSVENPLQAPHVKTYLQMLLKGTAYLHETNIMHRDLKGR